MEGQTMNRHYNRRKFVTLAEAGIAGVAGVPWVGSASAAETPQEADLVVFNAKVYTVDPKQMAIVPGFID
jgi:hypothetical protein